MEGARALVGAVHLVLAARAASAHRGLHGVLAARQLGQAALVDRSGTADAHTASAVVDALHAATMVPLALLPSHRRFALGQLVTALALFVAEVGTLGRGRR